MTKSLIGEVEVVRISWKEIIEDIPYLKSMPSLGEEYTRTFLLRNPNRICAGLKPEDLAGIEIPLKSEPSEKIAQNFADLLYIRESQEGLREFYIVETKDRLTRSDNTVSMDIARDQVYRYALLLKGFLEYSNNTNSLISPIIAGIDYPTGNASGFTVGDPFDESMEDNIDKS